MQQTLVKVNVSTGQTQVWGENGCEVGEPIYVPRPGAVAEDDGVVLSVVFDTLSQRNCLLVLDGQTVCGAGPGSIDSPHPRAASWSVCAFQVMTVSSSRLTRFNTYASILSNLR